jgi:hypothetical protein
MTVIDRRYSVGEGTAVKAPCRVATTANITLAGAQTIDGVSVTETNPPTRVLVKNQTDQATNGVYDVSTGNWTRTRDFDGAYDIVCGTRVFVTGGTANDYEEFIVTTADPIVVGTSNITFGVGTASAASAAAVISAASAAASATSASGFATSASASATAAGNAQTAAEVAQAAAEDAVANAYYLNSVAYGAVGDAKFTFTASITTGTKNLTDSSNPYVVGDVGKTVCIAGAGAAGAVLVSTITNYVSAGAVTIATNASATVANANIQWGTDNTTAFNSAIAALTKGGVLYTPPGIYLATSINATGKSSIRFCGAVQGVNNVTSVMTGTVIVPIDGNYPLIDTTATTGIWIEHVQLGWTFSPVTGKCGILAANSTTVLVDAHEFRNVFITGKWSLAPLYAFAVGGRMWNCRLWNYTGTGAAMMLFRNNNFAVTSLYQTIGTSPSNPAFSCYDCEFHDYTGSTTSVAAVYLRGCLGFFAMNCLFDSSTTTYGAILAEDSNSTGCSAVLIANNIYSESGNSPKYAFHCSGALQLSAWINNYTFATAKKGGGGTFSFIALETV